MMTERYIAVFRFQQQERKEQIKEVRIAFLLHIDKEFIALNIFTEGSRTSRHAFFAKRASEERDPHQHARARAMASLKDTYDEAEDILDEVEYETAAKKVKGDRQQGNSGAHYLSTFN